MVMIAKRRVTMAVGLVTLSLVAACGSSNHDNEANTQLASLAISPGGAQLAKGTSAQFLAMGAYSDLSVRDVSDQVVWASSDPTILSMNGGVVKALAKGSASVTAALSGKTAAVSVTVTDAALVSLAVTPPDTSLPKGTSAQMYATGSFTDSTTQDVTGIAAWASSDPKAVSVSGGLVTAADTGTATITAALASQAASARVTVTSALVAGISVSPPALSLPVGLTQQYTATCNYTDGQRDCTSQVSWSVSAGNGFASMSSAGLATGSAVGPAVVTASLGFGKCTANFACSTSVRLTVTPAVLVSISVSPATYTIPSGLEYPFKAWGQYSDNSSPKDISSIVTWASSDKTVAAWTPSSAPIVPFGVAPGLFTAYKKGDVTITASAPGGSGSVSGTATLHVVDAALYQVTVAPADVIIPKGLAQQFKATGYYTASPTPITADITGQVTWSVSNTAVATISNATQDKGLLSTASVGGATVTATDPATLISGSTTVTVSNALVMALAVAPASQSVPKGLAASFTANCTWTDNTVTNCSALPHMKWLSSDPTVASYQSAGNFFGVSQGQVTISAVLPQKCDFCTASVSGASAQAQLTVTSPTLVSIAVALSQPVCSALTAASTPVATDSTYHQPRFLPLQLMATGTYTDGTKADLTKTANWAPSPDSSGVISWPGSPGVVMGLQAGSVKITASLNNIVSPAFPLTIMNYVLEAIAVTPDPGTVPKGLDLTFQAVGTYCPTGSESGCDQRRCITPWVTWTEKDWPTFSNIASVDSTAKAHGNNVGWATISGADPQTGVSGSANLQVTNAIVLSISIAPTKVQVPRGVTEQFAATANYSDKTTQDVTTLAYWSSDPNYVAFDNSTLGVKGLATAVAKSDPTYIAVTATYAGVSGTIGPPAGGIDVLDRELLSVAVIPNLVSIPVGSEIKFTAVGSYTGGISMILGPAVAVWDSSNETVALISNSPIPTEFGLATGLTKGNATITAMAYDADSQTWISGNAALTVGDPWIYAVGITPQCPSVTVGQTLQMAAWGYRTDKPGVKVDLTNSVKWVSADPTMATVNSSGLVAGVAAQPSGSITKITITEATHGAYSSTALFVGCACGKPVYDSSGACTGCAVPVTPQ